MKDLVSVIMPVYNASGWLDTAVLSVIGQTYPNWELLAVDDGSTDDSLQKLQAWAEKDARIRVFHKENGGPAKARAFGLEKATGDYVFYLDSDDSISIDMFEVCLGVITTTNADVAVPNLIQRKPDGTVRDNFLECQIVTNSVISGQEAFERSIDWRGVWSYLMCKAYLYKKYACDERYLYGGFNSDELITRMILLNAKMVAYCPSEYYYNVNLESITKRITHKIFGYLETHIRLIQAAKEFGQPRNVMAKIETNAFREMIELRHKYRENRDLFSKEERRDVESQFASFYDRFPKGNVKALLAPRPGLTPKLQSLLMLHGWPLCKASLTLAANLGKKNKLYPWFSEEETKSLSSV